MIHSSNIVENHNKFRRGILLLVTIFIFAFNVFIPVKADNTALTIDQLLKEHNQVRAEGGLGSLRLNESLNLSAESKALAMLNSNCWDHYCPDGKSPWEFFSESGYQYVFAGENLAEGFANSNTAMTAWMNSKTHKENIMRTEFTEVGFGIISGNYQGREGNTIVVAHFGTPKSGAVMNTNRINILSPIDGEVVTSLPLDLDGVSNSEANFTVDLNGIVTNYNLMDSSFKIPVNNLIQGNNSLVFSSPDPNTVVAPSNVVIRYEGRDIEDLQTSGISIDLKSNINLIFVVLVIMIFLGDLFLIYKTNIVGNGKSLSHFHLALFVILAIVVVSGGVFGNILQGISN